MRELLLCANKVLTHRRAFAFQLREPKPIILCRPLEPSDLLASLLELRFALLEQSLEPTGLVRVPRRRRGNFALRQALDFRACPETLLVELAPRLVEFLPRSFELFAQLIDLFLRRRRHRFEIDGSSEAGGAAIELQGHRGILRHAPALLVQETKVDQRTRVALIGRLLVPGRGLFIVGCAAHSTLVDFPDVGLRLPIALVRRRLPDPERGAVVRPIVRDILAAAHLAISGAGLDRSARGEVSHVHAQLTHLRRKQAIHRKQAVGLQALVDRRDLRFAGGHRRTAPDRQEQGDGQKLPRGPT